ncbi:MAG: hypothetical protein PHW72_03135 [Candidatus Pacebacteria bacterium]|nr:hypothetical protein [Candidatus Paceibacterota bacterium]
MCKRFFSSKKSIFLCVFVLILLVVTGGLFWQKDRIEIFFEEKELEKMVAFAKDYSLSQNNNGKFIINEKDNFQVKVPDNWNAEIGMDSHGTESDRYVTLYSQDFSYRPQRGCLVEIEISRLAKEKREEYSDGNVIFYLFDGAKEVKDEIESYKINNNKEENIKIISVSQRDALQEIDEIGDAAGKYIITTKVPSESRVYIFRSILFSDNCNREMEQFLNTVLVQ